MKRISLAVFFCKMPTKRLLLGVLILVLAILSTWQLVYSPATWIDEGINLGIAEELATKGIFSLPIAPGEVVAQRQFLITSNYPVLIPVALAIKLGGKSLAVARLPMVLFLWIFVILVYRLVKRETGSVVNALWSVAFLITFTPFYGNGKAVLGEIPGLVYFLGGISLIPKEYRLGRLFVSGLLFGLAAATKPFFLIIGIALLIGECYGARVYKRALLPRLAWLVSGAVMPLAVWFLTVLPNFSFAGFLNMMRYYSNSYAATDFVTLLIRNSFRFFSESTPLHFTLLAVIVFFSWFRQWRRQGSLQGEVKIIIGAFVIINLLWYLKTPGWYRYFFTAQVLLFLWFPEAIFNLFKRRLAILCLFGLLLAQIVVMVYNRNNPLYFSTEASDMAALIDQSTSVKSSVLFINTPSTAFIAPPRQSYQFLQINPVLFFGRASLVDPAGISYQAIVAPSNLEDTALRGQIKQIQQEYRSAGQVGHFTLYIHL